MENTVKISLSTYERLKKAETEIAKLPNILVSYSQHDFLGYRYHTFKITDSNIPDDLKEYINSIRKDVESSIEEKRTIRDKAAKLSMIPKWVQYIFCR